VKGDKLTTHEKVLFVNQVLLIFSCLSFAAGGGGGATSARAKVGVAALVWRFLKLALEPVLVTRVCAESAAGGALICNKACAARGCHGFVFFIVCQQPPSSSDDTDDTDGADDIFSVSSLWVLAHVLYFFTKLEK
jgi:hypothetical protein